MQILKKKLNKNLYIKEKYKSIFPCAGCRCSSDEYMAIKQLYMILILFSTYGSWRDNIS